MKLFMSKDTGKYSVQVNSSRSKTYVLEDSYKVGNEPGQVKVEEGKTLTQKSFKDHFENRVKEFTYIFRNGKDIEGKEFTVSDMYSVPDAPILLPNVISTVVREAI